MGSSKKPDTKSQEEALANARMQQAELDEEENRRRKRILAAAGGVRMFAGSPMMRAGAARDSAPAPAVQRRGQPGTGRVGSVSVTGGAGGVGGVKSNPRRQAR